MADINELKVYNEDTDYEDFFKGVSSDTEEIYEDDLSDDEIDAIIRYADKVYNDKYDDEFDDLHSIDIFISKYSSEEQSEEKSEEQSEEQSEDVSSAEPESPDEAVPVEAAAEEEPEKPGKHYREVDETDNYEDTDEEKHENTDEKTDEDTDGSDEDAYLRYYDESDDKNLDLDGDFYDGIDAMDLNEDLDEGYYYETDGEFSDDDEPVDMYDDEEYYEEYYEDYDGEEDYPEEGSGAKLKRGFMSMLGFGDSGDEEFDDYFNDEVLAREEARQEKFRDSNDFFEEAPSRFSGAMSLKDAEYADDGNTSSLSGKMQSYPIKVITGSAKKIGGTVKGVSKHLGYFAVNVKRTVKTTVAEKKQKKSEAERSEQEKQEKTRAAQERRRAVSSFIKVHSRSDAKSTRKSCQPRKSLFSAKAIPEKIKSVLKSKTNKSGKPSENDDSAQNK